MIYILAALPIVILIVLIGWLKIQPFVAFLVSAISCAILLGLPPEQIAPTIERGIADMLGSLAVIICLGAMFGQLIAKSGAAQQIAQSLLGRFSGNALTVPLMLTGFVVGLPLLYNVGFVLLVPLVLALVQQARASPTVIAIPLLSGLSVAHGFLPPHPAPLALVAQFQADIGRTLLYGLMVALPTLFIAVLLTLRLMPKGASSPIDQGNAASAPADDLPSPLASFAMALLPILAIAGTVLSSGHAGATGSGWFALLSHPMTALLLSLVVATYVLWIRAGRALPPLMASFNDAIASVAPILLIIAGAGALKQVLTVTGVSGSLAEGLADIPLNPLILGWGTAALLRAALGSATVAGLAAAGIVAPLLAASGTDPAMMVLAVGAGSLMFSHVNDSGFWMFKEYFGLTIAETIKSWSLMETLVGLVGIIMVLLIDALV
ncbi:GntP family permease [Sphingobium algorifonticola]|uniref:Gluconate transporter n=1 Tax=Sphingobium algorifonticola TaxID=2008318 RepID=A0A437JC38_9SPHN|nr:gluconate:H+ symporter [Sphingobium algorifonticola]RVT43445.1 gluconate transporter [Sphingobium algorifonticola]